MSEAKRDIIQRLRSFEILGGPVADDAIKEFTRLQSEVERYRKNDLRRMEMMSGAWLLRKQAEAVEEASYSCQMSTDEGETVCGTWVLGKYASDLRQQADELENNNAQEH